MNLNMLLLLVSLLISSLSRYRVTQLQVQQVLLWMFFAECSVTTTRRLEGKFGRIVALTRFHTRRCIVIYNLARLTSISFAGLTVHVR